MSTPAIDGTMDGSMAPQRGAAGVIKASPQRPPPDASPNERGGCILVVVVWFWAGPVSCPTLRFCRLFTARCCLDCEDDKKEEVTEARARTPLAINKTSCDRPGTNNHYSQCFLTRSLKRRRRSSQRRQPSLAQTDLPMLIMQPKMSRRQFLR